MVSEVDICNRALIKVHAKTISTLTENSEEAVTCSILYPQLRDEVLRAHFWNFAVAQKTLQADATAPIFGFSSRYLLPDDYIRMLNLRYTNDPYKIKGAYLHTNSTSADIEYIRRETDTTLFDALFVTTLVSRLSAELSYAIAGSAERSAQLMGEYKDFLREAKRRDGQEGTPDDLTADLFVDSRRADSGSYPTDWTTS